MRLALPVVVFALAAILHWVVLTDAAGLISSLPEWADRNLHYGAGIAFWLSAGWVVAEAVRGFILHRARQRGTEDKLPRRLVDLATWAVFFVAVLIIISEVFHLSLTGLLATSGVFAAVVGFAVQRTIFDLIAGLALNVGKSGIRLGDWIETASGVVGQATQISWRVTHLVTNDGRTVLVPNSMLVGNQFTNFSVPQRYFRIARRIAVSYEAPAERVVQILDSALLATEGVLEEPRPEVRIDECADSGIVYSLNFWVPDYPPSFAIARQVVINALKFLDQVGLAPTYPRRDVTLLDSEPRQIDRRIDLDVVLGRVPLLGTLGQDGLADLQQQVALAEFAPGAVVVREGDSGTSLFVVVAGVLDVAKQASRSTSRKVGRLAPGDVFGETSLLTGEARSATVTAVTQATLLEVSKEHLQPILQRHPEALAELSRLEALRVAANLSALNLTAAEQQEIAVVGVATFLRRKIARFFGRAETPADATPREPR
jgi:small-conductance mechanosensitive channel/CRP-like cAMP-binding protein